MAHDSNSNRSTSTNFDDMSNADLIAFIGGSADPTMDRADLLVMAIEADTNRRNQR